MKNAIRWLLYPVAALSLTACAVSNGVYTDFGAQCIADAAERVAKVNWLGAETVDLRVRQGTYTPTNTYQTTTGQYCREFQQTITVGGQTEDAYGTACRQEDGTWQIVSN